MRRHFGYIAFLIFGLVSNVYGQNTEQLTLWNCLSKAFDENSDLRTLNNLLEIQHENQKVIRTSLFPDLSLNAGFNEAIQNSRLTFIDDIIPPSEITGARTTGRSGSVSAGLDLTNYAQTIMSIKAGKQGIHALTSENIARQNDVIIDVAKTFTDCLLSQETLKMLEFKARTSEQIAVIGNERMAVGATDSATYYQTLVNAEKDAIAFNRAKTTYQNTVRLLAQLIGENAESLRLDTSVFDLSFVSLKESDQFSVDSSYAVQGIEKRMLEQKFLQREAGFNMLPRISVFADYGFSNQTFQNGILSESNAVGPSYGVSVGYQFGTVKNAIHQKEISKLNEANLLEELEQEKIETANQFLFLNNQINDVKQAISTGEKIEKMSKLTLRTGMLSFQLGTKTITELREIQNQLITATFELKKNVLDLVLLQLEKAALQGDLKAYILNQ